MQSRTMYTPAAANTVGYASNVTGASWPLTNSLPGDFLAHQVTILNDTINTHADKTAIITGIDAQGQPQTETITLPAGSATATSIKFFSAVYSIVPSASIGVDTMDIGWGEPAEFPAYPLNHRQESAQTSFAIVITGTISVAVQHSYDSMRELNPVWFNHATLTAVTANAEGNYLYPLTAIRLKVNSVTAGATVALSVVQSC